jgi:hypothetical protein
MALLLSDGGRSLLVLPVLLPLVSLDHTDNARKEGRKEGRKKGRKERNEKEG